MPNTKMVTIQDVVVAANRDTSDQSFGAIPTGEYGRPERLGGRVVEETPEERINRIYEHIKGLVTEAGALHRKSYCDSAGQLRAENADKITRLVTNEFHFYVQDPLLQAEFEVLQQKIADLAKTQPENLHLVLGSFNVRAPNDTVMNITPHIECGPQPKINFIVKNYAALLDPRFRETRSEDGEIKPLHLVQIKEIIESERITWLKSLNLLAAVEVGREELAAYPGILIDGKNHPFSFNNVISCNTAGGAGFYSCIDVCYDHDIGVAKKNIHELLAKRVNNVSQSSALSPEPLLFSHVLTSCGVAPQPENTLGTLTHADPGFSLTDSKPGVAVQYKKDIGAEIFGTPATMIVTEPAACDHLLKLAIADNNVPLAAHLVQQGADVNAPIKSGQEVIKPIFIFAKEGNLDMMKALTNQGNISNEDLERAIFIAAVGNKLSIVDFLLEKGVDINKIHEGGKSLLHLATENNNAELVELLIRRGADLQQKNSQLETSVDIARNHKYWDISYAIRKAISDQKQQLEITSSDRPTTSNTNPMPPRAGFRK
jgi:hypothetical protein